ncbi:hypothetical protein H6G76_25710 [Nostoc sp. FACHB-152]|uniref:hypothetical protein n=1 Tax=Nostoc sp. FACHB-152 TaxID=2692837 RepID=UPI001682295A|nr:hypothetical protein [Nostoc sp. FACHB-152]MBD2450487.1 hypothetical protein [Nostoc sp. FACHB-152]
MAPPSRIIGAEKSSAPLLKIEKNMTQLLNNTLNGTNSQKLAKVDFLTSTSQERQEQLEILLCQKAQQGEDVSGCTEALYYFLYKHRDCDTLTKVWNQTVKEKSVFNALQRVAITAFSILGMIALFHGAFKDAKPSSSFNAPSGVERSH